MAYVVEKPEGVPGMEHQVERTWNVQRKAAKCRLGSRIQGSMLLVNGVESPLAKQKGHETESGVIHGAKYSPPFSQTLAKLQFSLSP